MWNKLNLIQAIPIAILIIFMFIPFYGSSITIEKPYLEEFNQCTEEKEILSTQLSEQQSQKQVVCKCDANEGNLGSMIAGFAGGVFIALYLSLVAVPWIKRKHEESQKPKVIYEEVDMFFKNTKKSEKRKPKVRK